MGSHLSLLVESLLQVLTIAKLGKLHRQSYVVSIDFILDESARIIMMENGQRRIQIRVHSRAGAAASRRVEISVK